MLTLFFAGFILFITVLVVVDLFVLNRKAHVIGIREALGWSAVWVSLALLFNVLVYFLYGHNWLGFTDAYKASLSGKDAAICFLNAYLLELSLSMDNLFVFATILTFFRVPLQNQHRVLVWGILGAILLRGVMIGAGAALIHAFDWVIYVFGALLIITAARMLAPGSDDIQPERNIFIRTARKWYPCTVDLHGEKFFVLVDGVRHMTPMFLALILVDIADVMFAIDSIPAAFGVFPTGVSDTFIVFTSNIFAIMGLRSMYFALVGMMHRFRYLKPSIVLLLAYIGVKMLLPLFNHDWHIPNNASLAVIGGILLLVDVDDGTAKAGDQCELKPNDVAAETGATHASKP
jgi:tellurite resistance protein TerC